MGPKVENLDFVNNKGEAAEKVNQWVSDKTEGKINKLISKGMLNDRTKMVLTNAIYFKGTWVEKFDKDKTADEKFKVEPGKTVQAPMMEPKGEDAKFNYTENKQLKALKMPYKGKDLSMLALLPKKDFGLEEIEADLTVDRLNSIEANMTKQEVNVHFPKFEFKTDYSLKERLKDMGMELPFTPGKSNFSGMDGTGKLFIQFVKHKAYVKVNEQGTEASASTGVGVGMTSAHLTPIFRADHPFLFMIKDDRTGTILFMGRVKNPTK